MHLRSSQDNDTLTVDFSQGNPVPAAGLLFDGVGTGDLDRLVLVGGPVSHVIHTLSAATGGTVRVDGSLISCLSTGLISDQLVTGSRTLVFGDRNDSVIFRPRRVSSGSGATVEFADTTGTLEVQLGGGDDRLTVEAVVPAVPVTWAVVFDGGPGDDYLEGGPGTDTLSGGPGHNILIQDEASPMRAAVAAAPDRRVGTPLTGEVLGPLAAAAWGGPPLPGG